MLRMEQAGYRVKQGCNMSGFLFLLVLDWVMRRTVEDGNNGIRWKFTLKLDDLDFADDILLLSSTRQQMQNKNNKLNTESRRVQLKMNAEKMKILRINPTNQESITFQDQTIEEVQKFTYLGTMGCKEGGGMEDLKNRQSKARSAFVKLKKIWRSSSLSRRTKLKRFRTLVVPVLAYGCETWKMNKADNKMLNIFQNKCLRKILRVRWEDHTSTEELLAIEKANDKPLRNEVKKRKWKMIGHILREDRNNITSVAMTWEPEGKRKRGRLKTTWRRTVEKERNKIGWRSWEEARMAAANQEKWKKSVKAYVPHRREKTGTGTNHVWLIAVESHWSSFGEAHIGYPPGCY